MVKIRFAVMLQVLVTDGFDIVAIGIEHEGAIIIRMIMRPEARRTMIAPARFHCRRVEGVDLRASLDGEGDMGPLPHALLVPDPEKGLAVRSETVGSAARLGLVRRCCLQQDDAD